LNLDNYKEQLKKYFPEAVHKRIDEFFETFFEIQKIYKDNFHLVLGYFIEELISNLENGSIKSMNTIRKIQNLIDWSKFLIEGASKEIYLDPSISQFQIKKIWLIFMSEISAGKKPNLREILKIIDKPEEQYQKKTDIVFRDITTSNLVVTISEILFQIEELFEKEIKGSSEHLINGEFEKIDLSTIQLDSDWAKRKIELGVRNLVLETKKELQRGLELYRLLHPIYKEMHVIISLMPHLLTMIYEEREGIEKIRENCNNIFNEFSIGADFERIACNLKEKVMKKREIEDIEVNVVAIKKFLKKIKDALNFEIFSNLRRLKIKAIIDEDLFNQATKIGLQLDGLTVEYGHVEVPSEFREFIIHSIRNFSDTLYEYKKLIQNRLDEEINIKIKPNLNELNNFIDQIQLTAERYSVLVPNHIAPIFASILNKFGQIFEVLNNHLQPLKDKLLHQVINSVDKKEQFYSKIKNIYDILAQNLTIFNDFINLGIKLTNTDGRMALEFVKNVLDQEYYNSNYEIIFQNSIKEVKRLLSMNTLSTENASEIIKKINESKETLNNFKKKYNFEQIKSILELHEYYKKLK